MDKIPRKNYIIKSSKKVYSKLKNYIPKPILCLEKFRIPKSFFKKSNLKILFIKIQKSFEKSFKIPKKFAKD